MNPSVMIVDDDHGVLHMIETILQDAGYDTFLVFNPLDAVAVAYAERPSLILLDLMMPAFSGGAVLTLLNEREGTHGIPVVVISASSDIDEFRSCVGVVEVLPKPFTPDRLLQTVHHALVSASHPLP